MEEQWPKTSLKKPPVTTVLKLRAGRVEPPRCYRAGLNSPCSSCEMLDLFLSSLLKENHYVSLDDIYPCLPSIQSSQSQYSLNGSDLHQLHPKWWIPSNSFIFLIVPYTNFPSTYDYSRLQIQTIWIQCIFLIHWWVPTRFQAHSRYIIHACWIYE